MLLHNFERLIELGREPRILYAGMPPKQVPAQKADTSSLSSRLENRLLLTGEPPARALPTPADLTFGQKALGALLRLSEEIGQHSGVRRVVDPVARKIRPDYDQSVQSILSHPALHTSFAEKAVAPVGAFVGESVPWLIASAVPGALGMTMPRLGAAGAAGAAGLRLGSPTLAQTAGQIAGHAGVIGLSKSAYDIATLKPTTPTDVSKNVLLSLGFEAGGPLLEGVLPKTLPAVVSAPIKGAVAAAAGTAAEYPLLTEEERENLGETIKQSSMGVGAATLLLSLLSGRAAFAPEVGPVRVPHEEGSPGRQATGRTQDMLEHELSGIREAAPVPIEQQAAADHPAIAERPAERTSAYETMQKIVAEANEEIVSVEKSVAEGLITKQEGKELLAKLHQDRNKAAEAILGVPKPIAEQIAELDKEIQTRGEALDITTQNLGSAHPTVQGEIKQLNELVARRNSLAKQLAHKTDRVKETSALADETPSVPVDETMLAQARVLRDYYANKVGTYKITQKGAGKKKYTQINEERVAKKLNMFDGIAKTVESGKATEAQIAALEKEWKTRTKAKKGRDELTALGYEFPEKAPPTKSETKVEKPVPEETKPETKVEKPVLLDVKVGDTVYYADTPYTVTDVSNPVIFKTKSPLGADVDLVRSLVKVELPKAEEPASAVGRTTEVAETPVPKDKIGQRELDSHTELSAPIVTVDFVKVNQVKDTIDMLYSGITSALKDVGFKAYYDKHATKKVKTVVDNLERLRAFREKPIEEIDSKQLAHAERWTNELYKGYEKLRQKYTGSKSAVAVVTDSKKAAPAKAETVARSLEEKADAIRKAHETITKKLINDTGLREPDGVLLAKDVADEWGVQQGLKPRTARKKFKDVVKALWEGGTASDIHFGPVRNVKNSLGHIEVNGREELLGTIRIVQKPVETPAVTEPSGLAKGFEKLQQRYDKSKPKEPAKIPGYRDITELKAVLENDLREAGLKINEAKRSSMGGELSPEQKKELTKVVNRIKRMLKKVDEPWAKEAAQKLSGRKTPTQLQDALNDVKTMREVTPEMRPELEGAHPGTKAWESILSNNATMKREMQARARVFWDDFAGELPIRRFNDWESGIWRADINKHPAIKDKGVSVDEAVKQIRARGIKVSDKIAEAGQGIAKEEVPTAKEETLVTKAEEAPAKTKVKTKSVPAKGEDAITRKGMADLLTKAAVKTAAPVLSKRKEIKIKALAPELEGVLPGSREWNSVLKERKDLKPQMEKQAKVFWDRVADSLPKQDLGGGKRGVWSGDVRNLPEVKKHGVQASTAFVQLRRRGYDIGDSTDRALDRLKVSKGATIGIETLRKTPEVKNKEVSLAVLKTAAEMRGVKVIDGEHIVELNCGIPLISILRNKKLSRDRRTRETFTPIQDVSADRGSVPEHIMRKLPDDVRRNLEKIDTEAVVQIDRIREYMVRRGSRAEMNEAQKQVFDGMIEELSAIGERRETWREAVDTEMGDIAKHKYSRSILNDLIKSKPISDLVPELGRDGSTITYGYVSPVTGKTTRVDPVPEMTKLDESILRSPVGWYARKFGVIRDVFGNAIATRLRNGLMLTQNFERDYQERLYKIVKPIIKNTDALERVTYLLEGKSVRGATEADKQVAAGLREWYNHLFEQFGIDAKRFLENYAPRIRKYGSITDAFGAKPPKELSFFAELERKAADILFPRETNALTAANTYLRLGARKKFIQPAFDVVDQYMRQRVIGAGTPKARLSSKAGVKIMHEDRAAMLQELKNNMLHRPVWEERLIQGMADSVTLALKKELGPKHKSLANELSAFATHAIYINTLGFNVMTVAKQLTQQVLAIGTLTGNPATGLKYWGKAVKALKTKRGHDVLKYCTVLQNRVYQEGIKDQSKILMGARKALEDKAFYLFEKADRANVSVSYMMKVLHALENKKPFAEAVQEANVFAGDTQFLYGFDSPMFYKSSAGRIAGVLTSYPVNFVRLMHKLLVNDPKGVAKVASTLGSLYATMYGLNALTGINFSSETPHGTVGGWLPLSFIFSGRGSIILDTLRDSYDTLRDKLEGSQKEYEQSLGNLQRDLTTFIPLPMIQLRRVIKALDAAANGGAVYDKDGKLSYTMSPGEITRSLFGPTMQAAKRREQHMKIQKAIDTSRITRQKAIDAYLDGNTAEFNKLQHKLKDSGFTPIRKSDVKQAVEYRGMTAIQRHKRGLPKTYVMDDME